MTTYNICSGSLAWHMQHSRHLLGIISYKGLPIHISLKAMREKYAVSVNKYYSYM